MPDIAIIIVLLGVAIFLVLLEIFFLPGITVAGIGGAVFAVGGIYYAYSVSALAGNVSLFLSLVIFGGIFAWLLRSRSFHQVALHAEADSRLTSSRELGIQEGDEGMSVSRLAPIGKARINGLMVEAKSTGDFIPEETPVVVVRVDGYNVIVKMKNEA
ncbi:MAG: NfeD family protein [Tannerellaceae bacterium]|nr:NfeD family protein [Tannerellaceae bacterium]